MRFGTSIFELKIRLKRLGKKVNFWIFINITIIGKLNDFPSDSFATLETIVQTITLGPRGPRGPRMK